MGFQVYVFNVGTSKLCTQSANGAAPEEFGRDHVSCLSGELEGVVDEIPTNCDTDMILVFFLWPMVDDNPSIGDCSVLWDGLDLVM